MSDEGQAANDFAFLFELSEALEEIDSALTDVGRDDDPEPVLWISLGEIVAHLCRAWHTRTLSAEDLLNESQEEFETRQVSVPNWGRRLRLVGIAERHPAIELHLSRKEINRDTVCAYLRAAEDALRALLAHLDADRGDYCDIRGLESAFASVLRNLCLAWHLRNLSGPEITSADPDAVQKLGCWLPPWRWNFRIIPVEMLGE